MVFTCISLMWPMAMVTAMPAVHSLTKLLDKCEGRGIRIILSHVNEQPRKVMDKAGFSARIGEENFCSHIDEALEAAGRHA